MLNTLWMAMLLLAFIGAAATGGMPSLAKAAAEGAGNAVETGLLLLGAMGLWSGLMEVAEAAGLANLLGMGNAATPLGLAAMDEMQRISPGSAPTKGMILFVAMNTASFQLLPTSVVTLRASMGSADPYDVLPCIWIVSFASLALVTAVCKLMERVSWKP